MLSLNSPHNKIKIEQYWHTYTTFLIGAQSKSFYFLYPILYTNLKSTIRYFDLKVCLHVRTETLKGKNLFLTKEQKLKLPMKKRWILTFSRWMKKNPREKKQYTCPHFWTCFFQWYCWNWIFAEKQYQEKNCDSKSLQTFKRWSFSDDFIVETNDKAQISLWKDKICDKHSKWVYFFSWIKEE